MHDDKLAALAFIVLVALMIVIFLLRTFQTV